MLDTNTASYAIRETHPAVRLRMLATGPRDLCMSAISLAELEFGVRKLGKPAATARIERIAASITVLPWSAASDYARLRLSCIEHGTPLEAFDMLIAAHAISVGAVLVTSDRDFYNVRPSLDLADWTLPM